MSPQYLLLFVAFIFLALAAFNVSHPRVNFGWLGLALWMLTLILPVVR